MTNDVNANEDHNYIINIWLANTKECGKTKNCRK